MSIGRMNTLTTVDGTKVITVADIIQQGDVNNIANYPIATEQESIDALSDTVYTTPLGVRNFAEQGVFSRSSYTLSSPNSTEFVLSFNDLGEVLINSVQIDTDDVAEAGSLYFTDARSRLSLSASGDISYDDVTGIISFSETYSTPAEIKTAYESNVDTNAFTDAEKTIVAGSLLGANNLSDVDSTLTAFNNIKQAATTLTSGVVEKATTSESQAGTSDNKFPDVVGVKAAIDNRALRKSQNLSDVQSVSTSRANLGLGSAALENTGTGIDEVPTNQDIRDTYAIESNVEATATLSSDNILNKHRIYQSEYGVVDQMFDQVWDVTRASTKTYVGADGLIRTALANTLPVSYDPETLKPVGRIVGEQRTNLLLWSEDNTNNGAWTKFNSTVTGDAHVSPDGTITTDTIEVSSNPGGVYQTIACSENTVYSASAFLGGDSAPVEDIDFALFNETAGVFINQAATPIKMEEYSNGMARYYFSITTPAGCTSLRFYPIRINVSSLGTVRLWGAQLEQGATPSSYIPTTSAQVTRAADSVVRTLGDEFNPNEFTLLAEFKIPDATPNQSLSYVLSMSDGTTDNFYGVFVQSTANRLTLRTQFFTNDITATNWVEKETIKIALVISGENTSYYCNGVFQGSDVSNIDNYSVLSEIELSGLASNSSIDTTATFADVRLFPYALTQAEAEALTS